MSKTLNANEDFLVKESMAVNYVAGIFLLAVFVISFAVGDYGWGPFLSATAILLIPAAFYLARAGRNAIIIRINKTGFFYAGTLVTNWKNYVDAVISQDEIVGSIQDNFALLIRYYGDEELIYTMKIPLSNTQDKAEEEIIEAIAFYYEASNLSGMKNLEKQRSGNSNN